MSAFLFGLIALLGFFALAGWFANQKTENAAKMVRYVLATGAILAGLVLSLRGVYWLGATIGAVGLGMFAEVRRREARDTADQTGRAGQTGAPHQTGRMSPEQARRILGVGPDADEAMIREAHRELMKKVHPDMPGGSDELARQVQEARDCLLPK